jgi:hypothetical protein
VPVTPTYPGVYIEEVPSPVHTIAGVDTSIAAFIGYTKRGQTNHAVEIFSYGDFERTFGGLDPDCPMTYAVQQFFNNGGTHAWAIRVAKSAAAAQVGMRNIPGGGGTRVLTATASSEGAWANDMLVEVDYNNLNPDSLFNLTITDYEVQNGQLVQGATELFQNLGMEADSPSWAVDVLKNNSALTHLDRPAGVPAALMTTPGYSRTAPVNTGDVHSFDNVDAGHNKLMVTIDGDGPHEIAVTMAPVVGAALANKLDTLGIQIEGAVQQVTQKVITHNIDNVGPAAGNFKRLRLNAPSGTPHEHSSLTITDAADQNLAAVIGFGIANGGIEVSGSAPARPAASGTLGTDIDEGLIGQGHTLANLTPTKQLDMRVRHGGTIVNPPGWVTLTLVPGAGAPPANKEALRLQLETIIRAAATAAANDPIKDDLKQARVVLAGNRLRVITSGKPGASIEFQNTGGDTTAQEIGLSNAVVNVAAYVLSGPTVQAQEAEGTAGNDGTAPDVTDFVGDQPKKKGLYALENVDLFNILCIPGQSDVTLLSDAMTYCEHRRALYIVDVPSSVDTLTEAQDWINNLPSKSTNAAAYFPWVMLPDPTRQYRPYPAPPSGMIAGLYARTDAARGVWKAPAGTEAFLRGPQDLVYKLTDPENGTINKLGLNAIRSLPIYSNVVWGARTIVGSDIQSSEWKYIPVRRIALFIEESLYRGTQWVVFEPNDEPLWAQIRLNVGAFMHSLFRQGAFQGKSPREAYLVKCDSETTTQDDINRGIVNILVGFAPLKPAEFVIIQISQLAGQLET